MDKRIIYDLAEVAKELSKFFMNIVQYLQEGGDLNSHYNDNSLLEKFVASKVHEGQSYKIPHISENTVLNIIKGISTNKATGHHSIST
mgnify:CR=1 FL=1